MAKCYTFCVYSSCRCIDNNNNQRATESVHGKDATQLRKFHRYYTHRVFTRGKVIIVQRNWNERVNITCKPKNAVPKQNGSNTGAIQRWRNEKKNVHQATL